MLPVPVNLRHPPKVATAACGVHPPGGSRHRLPRLWCLHLYNYSGELLVDGQPFAIRPGHASVLPPAVDLEYRFRVPSMHLYAHFALPREMTSPLAAPVMVNLGADFAGLYRDLEHAIGVFPHWPLRTAVTIWNILWKLVEKQRPAADHSTGRHPAVDRVIESIERRLHEPLYGAALAREVALSQHHLIRLFRATTGATLQNYIRQRRIQRAQHLLGHSTQPIKAIAVEVGIPDLHLFNKTVRQFLGKSPRRYRQSVGSSGGMPSIRRPV